MNPSRAGVARALGVRFALPERATGEADVVIHASGAPAGLALALQVAAFEATVVELSWYGDQDVPLGLGQAFHARRLTITSSQVGSVAAAQRAALGHAAADAAGAPAAREPGARRADHRRERLRGAARGDGVPLSRAGRRDLPSGEVLGGSKDPHYGS